MGGRLGSILNALRLAQRTGAEFSLFWQAHKSAANVADPGFFFDLRAMAGLGARFMDIVGFLGQPQGGGAVYFDSNIPRIKPEALELETWVIGSAHASMLPGERGPEIRAGLASACAQMLRFAPQVLEAIDRYPALEALPDMIGVHVRRGDIVDNPNSVHRNRVIPEGDYFRVIDTAFADKDIFLCTETDEVVAEFRARYGSRVVLPQTEGWDRASPELTRQAVAEMALLARCGAILARTAPSAGRQAICTIGPSFAFITRLISKS